MRYREILFTPRCSPSPWSFRGLVNFSLRRTVAELQSVKLPNFRILAYFPHTKPLKRTFRWPAYSPGVTSQNDSDFSIWYPKVQRGAFRDWRFPATSGRGAGDPQTCPNFRLWQMAIPVHICYYTGRQIWTKDVWKRAIMRTNVLSHQIFSHLFPKPHFWGPFNAKMLKLYGKIGIGKYLGCVKNFPLGGVWGAQGPLM